MTEAINLVAYSWGRSNVGPGDAVLVTQMEHHANLVPWQVLCRERGATLRYLEIDEQGELSLEQLEQELDRGDVRMVAFTHVSNVLGTINPVAEITRRAREAGAVTLVDGAQAVPQMPVDVDELGADFYGWTGHKALGPTGIGVLHGRREILEQMPPFLTGGDMISSVDLQEATWNELPWKFEAGTPMIAEAVGLAAAVEYLDALDMRRVREHELQLTARLLEGLEQVPGVRVVGPPDGRVAGRAGVVHARGHPPPRRRRAGEPRGRLHPRRPPLRPAADALPGRGSDSPRERGRLQRAGRPRGPAGGAPGGPRGVRARRRLDREGGLMDDLYRDYILDHYKHPRNFGELEPHDLEALEHNPLCGDELGVHIRVQDDRIADLRFHGHGCAISQAAASISSEELKGMEVSEAGQLGADWLLELLGIPISATRRKCALLGLKAVRGALTGDDGWPA